MSNRKIIKLFSGCGQVLFGGTGLGNYRPAVLHGSVPIGWRFKLGGKTRVQDQPKPVTKGHSWKSQEPDGIDNRVRIVIEQS